jgi:hypothetical protein
VSAYEVRRIDELDAVPITEAAVTWRPVRRTFGITAFGINAYTANEGEHVVEAHDEGQLGHEEVYAVIVGRARFTLGDDEVEASPGTLVYLRDPDTKREAVALEDGTTVLAVGGKPGEAYTPSAWEWVAASSPARERGDHADALAIVREGLESTGNPILEYHVAYSEALNGDREAALAHLRNAVEFESRRGSWAREDDRFASLHADPEFLAITREADVPGESA